MGLTHRQIETFRAVVLTGSLTQAAEALHTSQPTVSRVLADLSRAVGFPLFQRQGRRVLPTREGLRLFEEVESSYQGIQRIESAALAIRKTGGERLRIAAVTSVCLGLLPKAIAAFRKSFPDAALLVEAGRYDSILARVLGRQCDIGLALVPEDQAEVLVEPLVDVSAVCALPVGHPLCRKSFLTPQDLAGASMVFVGQHFPARQKIDALLAASGIVCESLLEVQSGSIACAMVAEGLGIAVLDALTILGTPDPRIVIRPLKPTVVFRYSAMMTRMEAGGRMIGGFLEAIKSAVVTQSAASTFLVPIRRGAVARGKKALA